MTINAKDFRDFVISPALTALELAGIPATKVAADLLMATAAVETALGTWLSQVGGPARGVFQIDGASFQTLWGNLRASERAAVSSLVAPYTTPMDQLDGNLVFAAAICRLFYWRVPEALPKHTLQGLWAYYKKYYNTTAGATTEAEFIAALRLTDIVWTTDG